MRRLMSRLKLNWKSIGKLSLIALITIIVTVGFYMTIYYRDNRYTAPGPQPYAGVLTLTEQDLANYGMVFLVEGWEKYWDILLSPDDFEAGYFPYPYTDEYGYPIPLMPDEYVATWYYAFFAMYGDPRFTIRSASYRMTIELPPGVRSYALEIPQLDLAYRVYINGELVLSNGNPDPDNFQPKVMQSGLVRFYAENTVEIVIAASAYSHYLGGMLSPPGFGLSDYVERAYYVGFMMSIFWVSLALLVGVFYTIVWLMLRKNKTENARGYNPLLYSILCFVFVATYIAMIANILGWEPSMAYYTVDAFVAIAVLSLIVLIQSRQCSIPYLSKAVLAFGLVAGIAALFYPHHTMRVFIEIYIWFIRVSALYLLISSFYNVYKNKVHSKIMFVATVVYATIEVMFSSMRFITSSIFSNYTQELVFVVAIGIIMTREVAEQFRKRLSLEIWNKSLDNRIEQQEEQFRLITDSTEKAIKARHDLRHHLSTLGGLLDAGDMDELSRHLSEYADAVADDLGEAYCANARVSALIGYYVAKAREIGADINISVNLPHNAEITDVDLCVVIGNCLENAVAAVQAIPREKRGFSLKCLEAEGSLAIVLANSFDGNMPVKSGNRFKSSKRDDWGIGLASVISIAEKYGGTAEFKAEGEEFHSEIVLPVQSSIIFPDSPDFISSKPFKNSV